MKYQTIPVFVDHGSYSSSQYSDVIQGIRSAASKGNQRIEIVLDSELEQVDYAALAPAAIVTGVDHAMVNRVLTRLRENGRGAVLAGLDAEQFSHAASCATPSRRAETRKLVDYLHGCGHNRIALVGFNKLSINDNYRYHAAMMMTRGAQSVFREEDVWQWDIDPRSCIERFCEVCDQYDAAICPNDYLSVLLMEQLRERQVRVPEDLFVASFGNTRLGRYHSPTITTMTMDMVQVGEEAYRVWRLLLRAEDPLLTTLKLTVPSRLLIRESTAFMPERERTEVFEQTTKDSFYRNEAIRPLQALETCMANRDEIDMSILLHMMAGKSYERIAEELFISDGTLRYRLNKIFADANVKSRRELEELLRRYLGTDVSFHHA